MLKPLADRIMIIPDKKKEVSDGGIIIPDSIRNKESFWKGKVVSCGVLVDIPEGSIVLYPANVGARIEETDYLILKYDDLWAII